MDSSLGQIGGVKRNPIANSIVIMLLRLRSSLLAQRAIARYGRAFDRIRGSNFLILGAGRSGTTLLVDYLNCNRQIRCHGEILGQTGPVYGKPWSMDRDRLKLHVEAFFVKRPGLLRGAKILTYQLDELPIELADLIEILARPKVLVLYREQLLEQFVSLKLAERDNLWHSRGQGNKLHRAKPIRLDPQLFLAFAERERRMWRENLAVLPTDDVHYLSYEQLTRHTADRMRGVFEFLGTEPCRVSSQLDKLNPEPISRKLANFRDFVRDGVLDKALLQLPSSADPASAKFTA